MRRRDYYTKEVWFNPKKFYEHGYPRDYFSSYFELNPAMENEIQLLLKKRKFKSALEIGPGGNPVVEGAKEHVYLDVSKEVVRWEENAVRGTIERLPFKDNSFDVVVACDVLTHILPENRENAIQEMARVSRNILIWDYELKTKKGKKMPHVPYAPVESRVEYDTIMGLIKKIGRVTLSERARFAVGAHYNKEYILRFYWILARCRDGKK